MPFLTNLLQPFYGEVTLQNGDDDIVGLRGDTAVDDQKISIEDPGSPHGFPGRTNEERGRGPPHEMLVQVELALNMVVSRARESCRNLGAEHR